MIKPWRQSLFMCLLHREWCMIWHSRADVLQVLVFYGFLAMLPILVQDPNLSLADQGPGALWVAALLSLLLSFHRILASDYQGGCLVQLLLGVDSIWQLVISKLCAYFCLQMLPLLIITPLCGVMLHMSMSQIGMLTLTFVLGMPVLLLLGFFMSILLLTCRHQALLLALLLLPLMLPVLLFSVGLVHHYMHGADVLNDLWLMFGVLCLALAVCPALIVMALRSIDVRNV